MDDHLPKCGLIYSTAGNNIYSQKTNIAFTKEIATKDHDPYSELDKLKAAAKQAKEIYPKKLIGGVITASTNFHYPFGDINFVDIMNIYAEQAFALAENGADFIFVKNINSVSHCRAAVLGARQTRLPVVVSVKPNQNFDLDHDGSVTAALIVSQALGAYGFCVQLDNVEDAIEKMEDVYPYAMIPLFLDGDFHNAPAKVLIQLEKYCSPCVDVSMLMEEDFEKLSKIFENHNESRFSRKDTESILATTEYEPFFLDERFEISESIDWDTFDEDLILDLNKSEYDVIGVYIGSENDIYTFIENAHLFTKPVAFRCDDPLLLEKALLIYTGRAFVESARCEIDLDELKRIARGYGALLR